MRKSESFDRESWIETEHPRIFYENETDKFNRGEYKLAKFITEHIPHYDVVITMGPYRMDYEVAYQVHNDEQFIHIDCYSAAFVPGMRKEHPAIAWAESAIHDIARGVEYDPEEDMG